MKTTVAVITAGLALASCQIVDGPTASPVTDSEPEAGYRIRSLVGPSLGSSVARALNDAGDVVGSLGGVATRWTVDADGDASAPEILLGPNGEPATPSEAMAVNADGQIVGQMGTESIVPFVWTEGFGIRELPLPAGLESGVAYDINEAGQVVGGGAPGTDFGWQEGGRVLLWTVDAAGDVLDVRDLGSFGGVGATGHGISALGEVVGVLLDAGGAGIESFFWSDPTFHTLPSDGVALAVNDVGTVAGEWSGMAAVWSSAGLQVFGPPGSIAHGLNNGGVVVGEVAADAEGGRGLGFVYSGGVALPLEALSTIDGARARAINGKGMIAGESYVPPLGVSEAVVWVPG